MFFFSLLIFLVLLSIEIAKCSHVVTPKNCVMVCYILV